MRIRSTLQVALCGLLAAGTLGIGMVVQSAFAEAPPPSMAPFVDFDGTELLEAALARQAADSVRQQSPAYPEMAGLMDFDGTELFETAPGGQISVAAGPSAGSHAPVGYSSEMPSVVWALPLLAALAAPVLVLRRASASAAAEA